MTGDGGPATAAEIDQPHGLGLTVGGDVLIADTNNESVRSVDADFVPGVPGVEPRSGEDGSQSESTLAPASDPVRGRSVVVAAGFGMVKVKLPGGDRWVLLEEDASIPVGSLVNTLNGSVVLTSAVEGEDGVSDGHVLGWDLPGPPGPRRQRYDQPCLARRQPGALRQGALGGAACAQQPPGGGVRVGSGRRTTTAASGPMAVTASRPRAGRSG